MANLTGLGEQYFLNLARGGLAAQYTTGYDRVAAIDDTDTIIDDIENITWGWTVGKSSITLVEDPILTIPEGVTAKYIALFNSGVRNNGTAGAPDILFSTTGDLAFADALAYYKIEPLKTFTNGGTIKVPSGTYHFDRIDI